jgi:hypothetical protein
LSQAARVIGVASANGITPKSAGPDWLATMRDYMKPRYGVQGPTHSYRP